MKKKVLALCLVLALTLAMMVPVLAASQTAEPCHTHTWVSTGNLVIDSYAFASVDAHTVYYHYPAICTGCATPTTLYLSYTEPHSLPCSRCMA